MCKRLSKHLRGNAGDANVSKMTLIAIVFVVGAILLVLTTSAFRNPINRWFDKVTNGWFAEENGMYEADNPFIGYERNANGTYKDLEYRLYRSDGSYYVVDNPGYYHNGDNGEDSFAVYVYDVNGEFTGECRIFADGCLQISEDGKTIIHGEEPWTEQYVAHIPQN